MFGVRKYLFNDIEKFANTAYTAHFVRSNFGYAEASYMLETLGETVVESGKQYEHQHGWIRF
jgi:uncharacterized protein with HEPN domain